MVNSIFFRTFALELKNNLKQKEIMIMIDIIKALEQNEREAIALLKEVENNTKIFAEWDENNGVYSNADECPYIRYADDDSGKITTQLVVGVRYNEEKDCVEILTTNDEYKKTDGEWFPIKWCDDISYWYVLEYFENVVLNYGK